MAATNTAIQPADLGFFSILVSAGSLSAAAREQGITTPAVSKRLSQMEARLGVPLLNRTTRRMSLTAEGELYLEHARRILGEIDDMQQMLGLAKSTPSGLLRVNATLGFGRSHITPVISRFVRKYPRVEVRLQLSVDPPAFHGDNSTLSLRKRSRVAVSVQFIRPSSALKRRHQHLPVILSSPIEGELPFPRQPKRSPCPLGAGIALAPMPPHSSFR